MASTYSTNLALELIGTGDQAGSWGNTTNTNLGTLIEQAISGYVTQAMTTGNTTTITIPNGATGVARNMYIEMTGTGGTNTFLVVPSNKKLYFIYNNTTGAVTVKVSGQTGVSVSAGAKVILVSNGTDVVNATSYLTSIDSSLTLTTLNVTTLTATSANITTLTGTTISATNMGDQTTTQFKAASANITTITGTTITGTNVTATSLTVTNALGVAQGGTGSSLTPTNGQLLIGNTSTGKFALSTLTAGSGVTITNNAGSITIASSGGSGFPITMNVVSGTSQAATTGNQYVLTNVAATTVTLPASPTAGDTVFVTVANSLTTNVVARNGSNIMSLAQDMTLDNQYAAVQLRYADSTRGWVLT